MINSLPMIILLRECGTRSLVMNSCYACYVLLLCLLCTPVMTSYDPTHSRNPIIMLISHKKDNLHGEWEEVMDAGMMPCL